MKYTVLMCGGMSDRPMPDNHYITPLCTADTPYMDMLAKVSEIGLVKTVKITELPAAEKSVLSLFGYDPKRYFKGKSVFYAAGEGIIPEMNDVIFKCSLVTLSDNEIYHEKIMLSDNAQNISEEEFDDIFKKISENLGNDIFRFVRDNHHNIYLIWKQGEPYAGEFVSPCEVLSECIGEYLPKGDFVKPLYDMMEKSTALLWGYDTNALWIWGEAVNPALKPFRDMFHLNGCVVTDTDFVRGIGKLADMKAVSCGDSVSETVIRELGNNDIVLVYLNQWYSDSLNGDFDAKANTIHIFDEKIVRPLIESMRKLGEDFSVMILSDIAVPVYLQRYANDPVPYLLYRSNRQNNSGFSSFNENTAADSIHYIANADTLMNRFILPHESI